MKKLEFKATGDWNLLGNNEKEIYISLVAKINNWKKNVIFRRLVIGEITFDSLLQQILNHKGFIDWEFSVSTNFCFPSFLYKEPGQECYFCDGIGNDYVVKNL